MQKAVDWKRCENKGGTMPALMRNCAAYCVYVDMTNVCKARHVKEF